MPTLLALFTCLLGHRDSHLLTRLHAPSSPPSHPISHTPSCPLSLSSHLFLPSCPPSLLPFLSSASNLLHRCFRSRLGYNKNTAAYLEAGNLREWEGSSLELPIAVRITIEVRFCNCSRSMCDFSPCISHSTFTLLSRLLHSSRSLRSLSPQEHFLRHRGTRSVLTLAQSPGRVG